jgi:histidine triad (HIT) family protein
VRRCIFCDIAGGTAAASVVYRGETCLAFMDVHPIRQGHVLVIPIEHSARLDEIDPRARQELLTTASRVLAALRKSGLARDGANLLLNDGSAANQHVPHVHIHVIPRTRGDRLKTIACFVGRMLNVFGRSAKRAELERVAQEIRRHF